MKKKIKPESWMPKHWTFKDAAVAENFEEHVREQLPWYDLVTKAVEHLARHYVPVNGFVYDIGASTGNVGRALAPLLEERHAYLCSIEESKEMAKMFHLSGNFENQLFVANALGFKYDPFDFATMFLVLMFLPVASRAAFLASLYAMLKPGGAILIVDKTTTPPGYAGTAIRRMAMSWKLEAGAKPEEIVKKELSLAGYQRPVSEDLIEELGGVKWFQFGEFAGWVIEKPE